MVLKILTLLSQLEFEAIINKKELKAIPLFLNTFEDKTLITKQNFQIYSPNC